MLMTYYTDNILYNKGIKSLPHFENLLHTFAMQYKIKVQGNIEVITKLQYHPQQVGMGKEKK